MVAAINLHRTCAMPAAALALADPLLPREPAPGPAATVVPLPKKRGPKTPEGKARSRTNALKHGLRAKLLRLPPAGDDAEHFEELAAGLRRTYRPEDAAEAGLVEAIAVAMWQEITADRLEAEAFAAMAGGDGEPFHGRLLLEAPANRAALHTVLRYQTSASCAVGRAMRLFFQHRRAKRDGLLDMDEADCTNELSPSPPARAPANYVPAALPTRRTNDLPRPDLTATGPLPMPFSLLPSWDVRLPEAAPDLTARAAAPDRTNDFAPTPTPACSGPRHPGVPPLPPGLFPPPPQISRPSFASSE
jgi:hypothetical protein